MHFERESRQHHIGPALGEHVEAAPICLPIAIEVARAQAYFEGAIVRSLFNMEFETSNAELEAPQQHENISHHLLAGLLAGIRDSDFRELERIPCRVSPHLAAELWHFIL